MKEFKGFIEGVLCVTLPTAGFLAGVIGTVAMEEMLKDAKRKKADLEAKANEKTETE